MIKNVDIDKYKYSGYGIGFDRRGNFLVSGRFGRNLILFGVDMTSSSQADNKKKDTLILGEGPRQRLGDTTLTVERNYSTNFTENDKKFSLSLN